MRQHMLLVQVLFAVLAAIPIAGTRAADRVRWDGQPHASEPTAAPEGALLNPSLNFWGDVLFTDVKLAFDGQELPGDGRFEKPVGRANGGTLTATFAQPHQISEIALLLSGEGSLTVETAGPNEGDAWQPALERASAADVPTTTEGEYWARLKLEKPTTAARWRVRLAPGVSAKGVTLWGSGPGVPADPIGGPVRKKFPIAFESLPGADAATFSDHIYWSWQRPLLARDEFKQLGAVWAQHDKWARLAHAPILPPHETLNKPVKIVMATNEHEGALLTLTSLRDQAGKPIHDSGIYKEFQPGAQELRVTVGELQGPTPDRVRLTLRVAGTLRTQLWGVVPGPLFSTDNKPGAALMMKYLTNGSAIADFPLIALPPCGSQIFWLEVRSDGAKPGIYKTTLSAEPGPSVPVEIEVLPVTLPTPDVWVHSWSQGAVGSTWPFAHEGTMSATVSDKLSRGITSFNIPRGEGPVPAESEAAEAKRQSDRTTFHFNYIVPDSLVHFGYGSHRETFEKMDDAGRQKIAEHVRATVERMKAFGLDYDRWYGEFWDEPGDANAELIELSAKWVKEVDPKVRVYVNPAFPEKTESFRRMSEVADVFVPFWSNWYGDPEWRKEIKPGRVNAFYAIQGSNRAELHEELVGHYRILPWHAFKLGLNGWGFYAYYGPRADPYTDYDPAGSETDYSVVYPGPRGPVPSRQAEAYRDGWEDYRLLSLLTASKEGAAKQAIDAATAQIPDGREPLTGTNLAEPVDFEKIRLDLLRAAAKLREPAKQD